MHLNRENLSALILGDMERKEADELYSHLARCAECLEIFRNIHKFDQAFRSSNSPEEKSDVTKKRKDCPDENILFRFIQGHLDKGSSLELKVHLEICPHCRYLIEAFPEELEEGKSLGEEPVNRALDRRLKKIMPVDKSPFLTSLLEKVREFFKFEEFSWRQAAGVTVPVIATVLLVVLINQPQLSLETEFIGEYARQGRAVEEFMVHEGEVLRTGDGIRVKVRPSKDSYLLIVSFNGREASEILFPHDSIPLENPLDGEKAYKIPHDNFWRLSEGKGLEALFILAQKRSLTRVEMEALVSELEEIRKDAKITDDSKKIDLARKYLDDNFNIQSELTFDHR